MLMSMSRERDDQVYQHLNQLRHHQSESKPDDTIQFCYCYSLFIICSSNNTSGSRRAGG